MKKLLITGSGGFIFSNFVRYILSPNGENKSKYRVVSIDKCTSPNVLNNIYANSGHKLHIGDIADSHFVDVIFQYERPDIVINAAAESFVDNSINNATPFIDSNVKGTQVLIDASLKYGVERFIQVSSDEIYGHLTSEDDPPWDENSPLNPRNPYSASKASAELLVKAAAETHGLKYNITRSCNNYGPRQPRRNLIPVIIANILENKPVPIYGQGLQIRDWLHVQDNCSAVLKIIESAPENERYNISSKQEYTNIEVFQEICNVLGKGYDLLQFVEDRKGHDFRYSITNDKIKALGWKPNWKFKQGLAKTVEWYQNNRWMLR